MAKAGEGMFKDWGALHQQWQSAVSDGVNRFMQGGGGNRWSDQFNGFGDLFGGKLGDTTDAATDRFVGGAKQYLDWVEKFSGQLASGAVAEDQLGGLGEVVPGRARSDGRDAESFA